MSWCEIVLDDSCSNFVLLNHDISPSTGQLLLVGMSKQVKFMKKLRKEK
jgi:hypothetical protein